MSLRTKKKYTSSSSLSVGWLFADLLLALAMLFLIANTFTTPVTAKAKPRPTLTKVVIKPTPSPTQAPRLELKFREYTFPVDINGLLNNSQSAINDVKSQIRAVSNLQGRRVGLAIAYGPAATDANVGNAVTIANKVYDILRTLGQEHFAFEQASYYSPLYLLGDTNSEIKLDIYLFAQ